MLKPSGWNQFDGQPGEYIVKWVDIVNRDETIVVQNTPIKSSTTSVSAIGDIEEVGKKLAAKREAKLVKSEARTTEGTDFYLFEFERDGMKELYQLCIGKGKLWSISSVAAAKRWNKRADLYNNISLSFVPKL